MAKSIRSKIKKRLRTAKRQRVDAMIVTPREKEKYEQLQKVIQGTRVKMGKPKNAFKYPESDDAFFPQHEVMKPIDFRAQAMPMVGYTFRGNRRKYDQEQSEYMHNLAKNSHPDMEIMAGGGAVHAKTGKKVSRKEAELMATAVQRPETSSLMQKAVEEEQAAAAASSSAAAAKEASKADGDDEDMDTEEDEADAPEPEGAADHSRRPVLKDMRKLKRKADHRPRPKNAAKGRRRTDADVQDALEKAAASSAKAKAAAKAPTSSTPAPAASAAASPKKGKKKGRKSGGGEAMEE